MEKRKVKIYCFFRQEERIQIFTLSDEEKNEYWNLLTSYDYDYNSEYLLAEKFLEERGVYTQDPQLTYIMTDSVMVTDDKDELITRL